MKRIYLLALLAATFSTLSLSSCSSDDDGNPVEDPCGIKNETEAYIAAMQAYSQTPTPAKCQAFKEAAMDYLEAADDCSALNEEAEESLEEARQAVEDLDCDE
ncbi:hypothetical protein [Sabulibacter ruber]|uniref:hypothetical protein n=1 Tax=Sabulibacter ruber TaxID=2811901 RepID=UPI001A9580D2|nr:hypothetical protein [Sabulibacter ruber]